MANTNNKIVLSDGTVLIDLTADTVTASALLDGYTAHDKSGAVITGSCTFDADTSDATAVMAEILSGKSAYVNAVKLTGTMPNRGGVTGTISAKEDEYTIAQGYHDGSGKVSIDETERAKIIPGNIKAGVQILSVVGTYSGETATAQSKTATPTFAQQTILPDAGYDYLSQVTVNAISVVYTDNPAGGKTVTIG